MQTHWLVLIHLHIQALNFKHIFVASSLHHDMHAMGWRPVRRAQGYRGGGCKLIIKLNQKMMKYSMIMFIWFDTNYTF